MKLLLPLLLFFTAQGYSQSISLNELEQNREELQQKIGVLEDSLKTIEKRIAEFPIKDISEPISGFALKGAVLRKEPTKDGEQILALKEKTPIQVIDISGNFYLICISGECGYLHKKAIRRTLSSKHES